MKFLPQSFTQLKQYENKWIAYTEPDKEIVGSGNDAVEAINDAKTKGFNEVVLFKIFPLNSYYIPGFHAVQLPNQ